ncbi:serine/threonine-protein kinase [Streptomyces sp. NPDC054784]
MQPLDADDPRTIGDYRLLRRLGAGGMGRVYLGRSPGGRTVAVKAVHPRFAEDGEFRERFRREVDAARRVGAAPPGGGLAWTAPVLAADPDARVPWVATAYVAGPTLQQAVADHGPLPEATVRALGGGLAEALAAVHGLGLVHRDVKPSNVLLTLDGPRLIDFGISRATDGTSALTSTGVSIGSPGYMSPEQVLGGGGVGPASDVFSMGAVLAYAATGGAPFPGDSSAALLYKVVHEEPELGGLDGGLRALVEECLAKRAADRPDPAAVAGRLAGGTGAGGDDGTGGGDRTGGGSGGGTGGGGGASGLIRPGWLPGPLVEEVSRSAVALLDLEPEEQREAPSGLVPFTRGSRAPAEAGDGAGAGSGDTAARAAAGAWPTAPSHPPTSPPSASPPHGTPAPVPPVLPARPPAVPAVPDAPPPRRGRFSVSADAAAHTTASATEGGPRGRQLSCTLVLSVAGALAVALLTSTFVFDLLPYGGGGTNSDRSSGGDHPSATGAPSPGAPTDGGTSGGETDDTATPDREPTPTGSGPVPAAFVGRWRGAVTTDSGLPGGTLTVTIREGAAGDPVATGSFELAGLACPTTWTLAGTAPDRLRVDAAPGEDDDGGDDDGAASAPQCAEGGADEEFTLRKNGTLRYESHDDESGNSAGTLRKIG